MTILDGMKGPTKVRSKELDELIEVTRQRISMLDTAELARLGAHEYDEEVVQPPAGSAGEALLREAARALSRFLGREGRFPDDGEVEEITDRAWHRDTAAAEPVTGAMVAQAYVDLGLFYSQHHEVAIGAGVDDLKQVLDEVVTTVIFTLVDEYAPTP